MPLNVNGDLALDVMRWGILILFAYIGLFVRSKLLEDREGRQAELIKLRASFDEKFELLKKELQGGFVPMQIAALHQQSMVDKITAIEDSVRSVRRRAHDHANQLQTMQMTIAALAATDGRLKNIEAMLHELTARMLDKAKRLSRVEALQETQEGILHDLAGRVHDLEKRA
jgi:chromosome segregation ATPase